ncbi:hypothetical protein [Bremerella sp. P1]|uniref:hypothetical protein n=1 Tax=Bremerella sp. P1 TaxID=3026424 RepID=UPI002368817B|nr:hypothetical protein [Bremerella sp. P1]WDI43490.1 hypothetical protein PSR63_05965 [Bremerella sp. P1]
MNQPVPATTTPFVDRRSPRKAGETPVFERRQFTNSHEGLSPGAQELALAIDEYKLRNRRRFITYEEMYEIITGLGYTQV